MRPSAGRAIALAGFAVATATAGQAGAQQMADWRPPPVAHESRFHFSPQAAAELHRLWDASTGARQERVACLGGEWPPGGPVRITRVLLLEPGAADSLGISAQSSIDRCGPPQWFGTVHTHIALRDGERPYQTFSGSDRGVMMMWWRRWRTDGTFCLLYTAQDAHCEVDGLSTRWIGGRENETAY
jgi:hypothetical protein